MKKEKAVLDALESAEVMNENDQPSYPSGVYVNYQGNLRDAGYIIVSLDVLHEFFNSKSDANKYLDASQQDNLESDFKEYIANNSWF